ncbi:MAG: metal ABC transporter ATP-binding protein [Lachnospiraceae bacterium]|nr:metal ABC transporter ATP-binding protein [Lachnospiraceae bacterium]
MKEQFEKKDLVSHRLRKDGKSCGLHCIKIKDIKVEIGGTTIIEDINLHIHCGQLTAVIGKNGAGKSTLMKAILGEVKHQGSIEFKNMQNGTFQDLKIGYVPQHINIEKNTPTSVFDLCAGYISRFPVFLHKRKKVYEKVKEQLSRYDAEDLIDQAVCDLSGGELQRVLLSIATTPIPNLLVLDEPVSGIDKNGMDLFYRNIEYLKEHYDLAVILVSHDLEYIRKYADNVVLMDRSILAEGRPESVFHSEAFINTFGNIN